MTRTAKTFEVVASHHPAFVEFVLAHWKWRCAARAHAWLWERVLGDGVLWPYAYVREVSP